MNIANSCLQVAILLAVPLSAIYLVESWVSEWKSVDFPYLQLLRSSYTKRSPAKCVISPWRDHVGPCCWVADLSKLQPKQATPVYSYLLEPLDPSLWTIQDLQELLARQDGEETHNSPASIKIGRLATIYTVRTAGSTCSLRCYNREHRTLLSTEFSAILTDLILPTSSA